MPDRYQRKSLGGLFPRYGSASPEHYEHPAQP